MTTDILTFDEIVTLVMNAMEFEGLTTEGVYEFALECGLSDAEADEISVIIVDEVLAA